LSNTAENFVYYYVSGMTISGRSSSEELSAAGIVSAVFAASEAVLKLF